MTRAEKLFVVIWIINLIIAVVYFLCGTFSLCSSDEAKGQRGISS